MAGRVKKGILLSALCEPGVKSTPFRKRGGKGASIEGRLKEATSLSF